jgi:hypothetical protein
MGCIARLGCLTVLALVCVVGWFTRDRWMHNLPGARPATTTTSTAGGEGTWQPLTPAAAERGRRAIDALNSPNGPVFANLSAAELTAYVSQAAGKMLPASADSVEAAVVGDAVFLRAVVPMKDIAGSGALGPLGGLLNARERIQLGGALHVIRPGMSEFQVRSIKLRDFNVPAGMIPRLVQQITKGKHVEGVAADALPVPTPRNLADVRIANGRVTLYKTAGTRP